MIDSEVKWLAFGSYSGPSISQGTPIPLSAHPSHVERAYWLTAKVETGAKLGAVMAYDGTCMTAGPDQHIAVYPKELANEDWNAADDQGSLWQLLQRLQSVRGSDTSYDATLVALESELAGSGFKATGGALVYVADATYQISGKMVAVKAGALVNGNLIRETFTGPGGKVLNTGARWDKAKRWAQLWAAFTGHPHGFAAQLAFGEEHLVTRTRARVLHPPPGTAITVEQILYGAVPIESVVVSDAFPAALDLAACVFHANSVNGPAPAITALQLAYATHKQSDPLGFARTLIQRLGNNTYGRWDDDIENGRYQRTRTHAMNSGLWPAVCFSGPGAVMPKDLPG